MSGVIVERNFKGVWIPKEIWLNEDLGWTEKMLLVEIDSLDNEEGCYASNEYFAGFFGLSKGRISKMISSLKEKGYISVTLFYKDGTKQIDKRVVKVLDLGGYKTTIPYETKRLEGVVENNHTPMVENSQDNNTVFNNTFNNTINKRNKDKSEPRYGPDDDCYKLSELLYKMAKQNNEKFKEPNMQSWSNDFRLMMEIDNYTPLEIQNLIVFSQKDSFWKGNILSASKLRKQAITLTNQLNRAKSNWKQPAQQRQTPNSNEYDDLSL